MAFQSAYIETTLMGSRGHVPQIIVAALVGADGRPLGVSNSVVYWETLMADPPQPGPKTTVNASRIHRARWRAGQPLPLLWPLEKKEKAGKAAAHAGGPAATPLPDPLV